MGIKCAANWCDKTAKVKGLCQKHYQRQWSGGSILAKSPQEQTVLDRFESKFNKGPGCWLWTAAKDINGYGWFGNGVKVVRAHRHSYETYISAIPSGKHVLHSCDTPSCVNPAHLRVGTNDDNRKDMVDRGRSADTKGTKNGRALLSAAEVLQIRELCQVMGQKDIGDAYGVSNQTVSGIFLRVSWRHI